MAKKSEKSRERSKRGGSRGKREKEDDDGVKAWYITWPITGVCFLLAVMFYFAMMQAAATFRLDLGNSTGWSGIFGSIFGTIGAVAGIAGVYGELVSIFLWAGIGMAVVSTVLTIVQRPKEK